MEHGNDNINKVKVKVKVTDLILSYKRPLAFESMSDCARYFGKSRSWLSQRFKRSGKDTIEYAGFRIEVFE